MTLQITIFCQIRNLKMIKRQAIENTE